MSTIELQEKYNDLAENLKAKEDALKKLDSQNQALIDENYQLKKTIERVEKEKDEALSRLSKIAGQKLMKGNPAIADLGNPNRAGKVAERWGSLYTDEWSDAYEEIAETNKRNKRDDAIPEKELMDIVVWCYEKCKELENTHHETVKENLLNAARHVHVLETISEIPINHGNKEECSDNDNTDQQETLETFIQNALSHRQRSTSLIESVKNKCITCYNQRNESTTTAESNFVLKCVELCWLLCIADPPMVIEFENFEGMSMDVTKFNKYNKMGTLVEFVVWPVLLLHKDGPVLSKGTVQTRSEDRTNNNTTKDPKNQVSQPPVKCNGGSMETGFVLVAGTQNDNVENNEKDPSRIENNSPLNSKEYIQGEIMNVGNEQTDITQSLEESGTKVENSTNKNVHGGRNFSPHEQTISDDPDLKETGNTKQVEQFKESMDTFIQDVEDETYTEKMKTKVLVRQSSVDNTLSANIDNKQSKVTENKKSKSVSAMIGIFEPRQIDDSNLSSGKKVTDKSFPNTKYYVKSENVPSGKKHTDTLHRNVERLIEKSKVPRQYSVDKNQPY